MIQRPVDPEIDMVDDRDVRDVGPHPERATRVQAAGHQRGGWLRAYDKGTGQDVADLFMPAPQTGSPMTYSLNGKQYLIVAISGAGFPAELIAYTAPAP